ncbi:MAG: polysaccharide deacetylase family protein [Anaerovoracaceae bacterium]|jgi:peptidoglycan/xylan/chitin deacetylase (PgdA/CDA1 family)
MNTKRLIGLLAVACLLFCVVQVGLLMKCLFGKGEDSGEAGYESKAVYVEGEEDIVIRKGNEEADCLALTCNVDWGTEVIPRMLKIFKEKQVKITFFVSGRWAENNPKLLREMFVEGHEIQSHGYGHKLCSKISSEAIKEEIERTENAIYNVLGVKTHVFAPPSGDYDKRTLDMCREMGYRVSLWSSDTIDWREGSGAEIIKKRVLDKPLAGAIVLMHPKEETVKALPSLIDEIKLQGIGIVPLSQLIGY